MSGEHDAYVKDSVSTHAFLWPFTFSGEKPGDCPFDYDKEHPEKSPAKNWEIDKGLESDENKDDRLLDAYMKAQYFNRQTREIFVGKPAQAMAPAPPCTRFRYAVHGLQYLIEGATSDQCYYLPVHQIRLFLFHPCGVGVLVIEAYNTAYPELGDITRINDLGRRIRLPFIPRKAGGKIICANRLGIIRDNDWHCVDFRGIADDPPDDVKPLLDPPDFVYELLGGTLGTNEPLNEKLKEVVFPASDDRMFLVSLIKDNEFSSLLSASETGVDHLLYGGDSETDEDKGLRDKLYSTVFADSDGPTCQNSRMQKQLLKKTVYPRWSRYGTLYVTTNLSVMCVTERDNESIIESVYRAFLTEYMDMAVLVLAQRVSIESFAKEASDIVKGAEKRGLLDPKQIEDIIDLHERYVTWQNRINLFEVTDQEQGVEIYARMREQMGVNGRIKELAEQLEDMYSIANVNQNTRTNKSVVWWAYAAIVVDVFLNLACFMLELTESGKGFTATAGAESSELAKGIWWIADWGSWPGRFQPLSICIILYAIYWLWKSKNRKAEDLKAGDPQPEQVKKIAKGDVENE